MKKEAALFSVDRINFSYKEARFSAPIFQQFSCEIPQGKMTAIVGPSGTGKTTLLNLLGTLDVPDEGEIWFKGQSLRQFSRLEKQRYRLHQIGFIFQDYALIPTLSVLENTIYFLPHLGYSLATAKKRGKEVLEKLGLENHMDKYPSQLSGGQKQRVAVARAIAKKPHVILADEPTANLDPKTALEMIDWLSRIQKEEQIDFVFSTHDKRLIDKVDYVIDLGIR
ncbi:MAG: ATP-binding cassette domain-containing protein [Bdellovibrionaceae bacterium]|nr:ATP-binding cassette domain-containing protein [Pseudobdellovibrionaceae bacterium]MDW8189496.1 ATP-binding cassette domain-containing protein [Pseudobdellovibrionaceae bacterium]